MPAVAALRTNAPVRAESRALRAPGATRRGPPRATGPLPTSGKVHIREAELLGWKEPERPVEFRCKLPKWVSV